MPDLSVAEYVPPKCMVCGKGHKPIKLPYGPFTKWFFEGELIQNAFPDLDIDTREILKTGTHSECFDSLFKDDEK